MLYAVSIINNLCTSVVEQNVKYRKSIEIVSKSTRYRYRIFRRYRYFKIDPIPDTSSTRYRFSPIPRASGTHKRILRQAMVKMTIVRLSLDKTSF